MGQAINPQRTPDLLGTREKSDGVRDRRAVHRRQGQGLRRGLPGGLHLRGAEPALHPPRRVHRLRGLRARVPGEGQKLALFRVGEAFYALSNTCTHRGGPLSEGTVEGAEVTCPWHGARFDIKTGAVMGPPAGREVKSYPVRVAGADVEIEV